MAIKDILKLVVSPGSLVAIMIAFSIYGYGAWNGYERADAKGKAALDRLQSAYDAAYAEAAEEAAGRLRKESEKALKAGADYAKEKENHEKTRRALEKRIASLGDRSAVAVDPEIVRLLNEAVGACGDGAGENTDFAGTHGAPLAGVAACSRLRAGTVTSRDLAAFVIYYGTRTRKMESQLNALITRIEEYNQ